MGRRGEIRKRGWKQIATAKRLVERYEKLPSVKWLKAHGYGGLYQWLNKHPEFFNSLPRHYDFHGFASTFKKRWKLAKRRAQKLKGSVVLIGRSHGTAVYTGNLNIAQLPGGIKNWVPEIKCLYCKKIIKRSEHDTFPTCQSCIALAGGLEAWKRHVAVANVFGLTATKVMQKRDSQSINGFVCCAICGVAETWRRHSQDHDQRFPKRSGKGNRDLLCAACNMSIIPLAEKIVSGECVLPPHTGGIGWVLLVKAVEYVEQWDRTLNFPRKLAA